MFCANCGNKLADGSNFCPKCGNKVGEVSEEKQTKQAKQTTSSDSIPEAAKVFLEQGNKYFEIQDFKKAYDAYKNVVQIAPDFLEAHKKIAQICIFNQDKKQALKILDDVISKNPADHEAFYLRGKVNFLLGKIDKALMDLDISLKFNPGSLDIYKAIISAYNSKKNWDNMIKIASEAIKDIPNDAYLYNERGTAFFKKESYDNAISDYSKALEINPNSTESLSNIAVTYYKKGEYDKALINMNRFLEIIPDNADCLYIRGQIYFAKGEYKKALTDFELLFKSLKTVSAEFYLFLVKARYKTGWYETNQDSIMKDYLTLWNSETDDEDAADCGITRDIKRTKKLEFFKDIMLDRYKKAAANYNQKKNLFLIYERHNLENKEYDSNIDIRRSTVINPSTDYDKKEPMLFFDKSFADDYCELIKLYNENKYIWYSPHKNEDSKIEPQYWAIIHAYTGEVYYQTGKVYTYRRGLQGKCMWSRNYGEKDQGEYKYNSLEDALKDYEKVIRDKHLCKTNINYSGEMEVKIFDWEIEKKYYHENNFMDIFIVGST